VKKKAALNIISNTFLRRFLMKRSLLLFSLICSLPVISVQAQPLDSSSREVLQKVSSGFVGISKKATPAVVFIESQVEQTAHTMRQPQRDPFDSFHDDFFRHFFSFPFQSDGSKKGDLSRGSGFIVSQDGFILTNNHVVENASKVMVTLHDGRKLQAKVMGTDPQTDLAVIKVEGKEFPHLELGDSEALEVGEWAIAIGNPFGLQATLTVGVVSAKGRSQLHIADFEDFIQTDAAINPGNSGGPLLNIDGHVIGVNTAIASASGGYMGIGFAIPSNMAKLIMKQLIENGTVTRGFLGVVLQPIDSDIASFYGLERPYGALVTEVVKDSPAEEAGLNQEDIILRFNDETVENINSFRNAVSLMAPNTKLKMEVLRNGKRKTLYAKIRQAESSSTNHSPVEQLGLAVQELTPEVAKKYGYSQDKGVIISKVMPGTPAEMANLKPGSLILAVSRKKVSTVEEFQKSIAAAQKEGRVLLMVQQGDVARFVALHFEEG
jgi:serine protease Do